MASNTDIKPVESIEVDITLVDNNVGQIPGVRANPREMTEMEFRKLKKSLQRDPEFTKYSELKLFPLDGRWVTIGGNMRLQAMRELGWTKVIGKPLDADTPAETLNRYILIDNANFGKWDFDKLANEWEQDILQDLNIDIPLVDIPEDEESVEEDNPDMDELTPEQAKSRLGDIYRLGDHILMCGDSTKQEDVERLMGGQQADLLLTDPPYNVDYSDKNKMLNHSDKGARIQKPIKNDKMEDAAFTQFLTDTLTNADSVMKQGAAFYLWLAATYIPHAAEALSHTSMTQKQMLVWVKNNIILGRQDYQYAHEPCLYGWKDGAAHYFINDRSQRTTFEDDKAEYTKMSKAELLKIVLELTGPQVPTTVIREDKPLRSELHPTMKPVRLMGRLIRNSSRHGEIVLDLFGGSGSTMIACEQLGRRCYMMEYDPIYADVIVKRWEDFTGFKAEYLGNMNDETEGKS